MCRWPKCYHVLNWFFLPKPGFLEFIRIFNTRNHLKNQYLPHSKSKSYQINSIKSYSSKSFQQHQNHIPIPPKISATIQLPSPYTHWNFITIPYTFVFQWKNSHMCKQLYKLYNCENRNQTYITWNILLKKIKSKFKLFLTRQTPTMKSH
jgi:hypothetical protein